MPQATPLTMHDLLGGDDAIDEFAPVPRQERIERSLTTDKPPPRGALTPTQVNNITKARIRASCAELVHGELANVKKALDEIRGDNPKVYLDQLMAFMEFSMPKLKAMELDVSDNRESTREMTLAELEAALKDSVVSTQ
jgi:hypothetical protein